MSRRRLATLLAAASLALVASMGYVLVVHEELTPDLVKDLVPRASAIPVEVLNEMARAGETVRPEDFPGTLSGLIVTAQLTDWEPSNDDFHPRPSAAPAPPENQSPWVEVGGGMVTILPRSCLFDVTITQEGDRARGSFWCRLEGSGEVRVEFQAKRAGLSWRMTAFRLPLDDGRVRLVEDGTWERFKPVGTEEPSQPGTRFTVLDVGELPRREVRFDFQPGASEDLRIVERQWRHHELSTGELHEPRPRREVFLLEQRVIAWDEDRVARVEFILRNEPGETLATFQARRDERGRILSTDRATREHDVPNPFQELVTSIVENDAVALRVPSVPIGVGARWRSHRTVVVAGTKVHVERTWTVERMSRHQLTLASTLTGDTEATPWAGDPVPGVEGVDAAALELRGSARQTVDLRHGALGRGPARRIGTWTGTVRNARVPSTATIRDGRSLDVVDAVGSSSLAAIECEGQAEGDDRSIVLHVDGGVAFLVPYDPLFIPVGEELALKNQTYWRRIEYGLSRLEDMGSSRDDVREPVRLRSWIDQLAKHLEALDAKDGRRPDEEDSRVRAFSFDGRTVREVAFPLPIRSADDVPAHTIGDILEQARSGGDSGLPFRNACLAASVVDEYGKLQRDDADLFEVSLPTDSDVDLSRPTLTICLDVVEPGREDMRGTRVATRHDTDLEWVWKSIGSKPPGIRRSAANESTWERWARAYRDEAHPESFVEQGHRSPLRLIRYEVRERNAEHDQVMAVCYSIEELHRIVSEAWWKLRNLAQEQHPLLIVETGRSPVLVWVSGKAGQSTLERRPLIAKPRFAPPGLVRRTVERLENDEISATIQEDPRYARAYWDGLRWNVTFEDVLEVLRMLDGPVLGEPTVREPATPWTSLDSWPLDPEHRIEEVFAETRLQCDPALHYLPARYLDEEHTVRDDTPLRRPK